MQDNLDENDEDDELNRLLQHLPLLTHLALLTYPVNSKFLARSLRPEPLAGRQQVPPQAAWLIPL